MEMTRDMVVEGCMHGCIILYNVNPFESGKGGWWWVKDKFFGENFGKDTDFGGKYSCLNSLIYPNLKLYFAILGGLFCLLRGGFCPATNKGRI